MKAYINDFVFAFVKGEILDVLLLACVPCIVIVGGFVTILMAKLSTHEKDAYKELQIFVDKKMIIIKTY